jgi:uncharacterized protein (DUF924 family)
MNAQTILDFWFTELTPEQWWGGKELDAPITERFGELHARACQGECFEWRITPHGRLAEIIMLDQFSRNIHRGTAKAFAADPMALTLSQAALVQGADRDLNEDEKLFLVMPFMHSESLLIHEKAAHVFSALGELQQGFEQQHKVVIDQFGRYPYRNKVLGRESTPEELEYLKAAETFGQ